MWYRPSKNVVLASEQGGGLAQFRPSNQAQLLAADPTNPSASDPRIAMSDAGIVRMGNGPSDNGLSKPGETKRFISNINRARHMLAAKRARVDATGMPNASPTSYTVLSVDDASAGMPNAPGSGKVMVTRVRRNNNSAWQINRFQQYGRQVFESQLVQSTPSGQQVLDQSPPLTTETDARNFIQAHEFQRTNVLPDTYNRANFGRSLFERTNTRRDLSAGTTDALARSSGVVPFVSSPAPEAPGQYEPRGYTNLSPHEVRMLELDGMGTYVESPAYQGSNGMGSLDTKTYLIAGVAVIGLLAFLKFKR